MLISNYLLCDLLHKETLRRSVCEDVRDPKACKDVDGGGSPVATGQDAEVTDSRGTHPVLDGEQ